MHGTNPLNAGPKLGPSTKARSSALSQVRSAKSISTAISPPNDIVY